MKKHWLKFWESSPWKLYESGKSVPQGTLRVNVETAGDTLKIMSDEGLEEPRKCWIFVYDKQNKKTIGGFKEADKIQRDEISFCVSEDFINAVKQAGEFEYGRICLLMQWQNKYACVYLKAEGMSGKYIGSMGDFSLYFSKGDLLSAKLMTTEDGVTKSIYGRIKEYKQEEAKLSLEMELLAPKDNLEAVMTGQFEVVSKITGLNCEHVKTSFVSQRLADALIAVTLTLDFSQINGNDFCAYYLVLTADGERMRFVPTMRADERQDAEAGKTQIEKADIKIEDNRIEKSDVRTEDNRIEKSGVKSGESVFEMAGETTFQLCLSVNIGHGAEMQIAKEIYPYMVSVILPVHNDAKGLAKTLESLSNQETGGLSKFLIGKPSSNYRGRIYQATHEVILVDDGSGDACGSICDAYQAEHANVTVLHQEYLGRSAARNRGIEAACGKMLCFVNSGDILPKETITKGFKYFNVHYDEVNMIVFPTVTADSLSDKTEIENNDPLRKGERIVDLWKEPKNMAFSATAAMFKTEAIKGKVWFDENLTIGEDIQFVYALFINATAKYGVTDKITYISGEIVSDKFKNHESDKSYYTQDLERGIEAILKAAEGKYGFVPKFVQTVAAFEMQWRYLEDKEARLAAEILGAEDYENYKKKLAKLTAYLDTDIIFGQANLHIEQKYAMLLNKYGRVPDKIFDGKDEKYFYEGRLVYSVAGSPLRLEFAKIKDSVLTIEGYGLSFEENSSIYVCVNGEMTPATVVDRDKTVYVLGEPVFKGLPFRFDLKLDDSVMQYAVSFYEKIGENYIKKTEFRMRQFMPISGAYSDSYYFKGDWCIRRENEDICIKNYRYYDKDLQKVKQRFERDFIRQIEKKLANMEATAKETSEEFEERKQRIQKAVEFRKEMVPMIEAYRQSEHKKIWLVSDRVNMAGDNGEALFIYLMEKKDPDAEVYFVIEEDSPDYERMCKIGPVLIQNSREHLIKHLLADCVLSAQAGVYVYNPFYREGTTDIFRDLLRDTRFVFLQHGIIKDDMSGWLNRYNRDMTGFVTAAVPEYKSIFDYNYYHNEETVWLTGLPRHDRLYHDEKKYVTIMPTWRQYLAERSEDNPEVWTIIKDFKKSDFFKFYNELFKSQRLLEAAEQYGYQVCFMAHPALRDGIDEFEPDPRVTFWHIDKPYREVFSESSLVITDYSSAIMDFAYLRKPVIYWQFDRDVFFAGHTYEKGYFDYDRDGFGEVAFDLEELVDVAIEYMKNDCQIKPVYKEKMDRFFAYSDKGNCERVYQKLKAL